ncbi:alpha/beta hydrolase [Alkalilimnicola sp. S0819]|uniref:alpha/beta hydrolase n=1 Tax=Alkalilimnicola sp. S0819 TaxID=2613922 RepID=UPI001261ABD4|nr:alpha/beta hydrolase [Alkalilimnicola sp. S0819]KAB7619646.1 alpha/beta hydrolase [Alkalilimnicola sp. S0819]MPQ17584.1 alpha/beta fold hydrolase [Alkalilimnicola sp. S0819]
MYRLGLILLVSMLLAACGAPTQNGGANRQALEARFGEERIRLSDGTRLPLRRWLPAQPSPQAVVLALHGFNDYSRAFQGLGHYLAERGIASYAYDQRGFGETASRGLWAGGPRMIDDARAVLLRLRQRYPDTPVYLLGESMGGAVALSAAAEGELPADGLVLLAPAVWARQTMPWYQRTALWVAARVAPEWRPSGKGLGRVASDNTEMLRGLGRDPLVIKKTRIEAVEGLANLMDRALAASPALPLPTLILYGARDDIVPRQATCRMLRSLPGREAVAWRFAYYQAGYHMLTRDLQGERVMGDIVAWLQDPQAALPSGEEATGNWAVSVCGMAV